MNIQIFKYSTPYLQKRDASVDGLHLDLTAVDRAVHAEGGERRDGGAREVEGEVDRLHGLRDEDGRVLLLAHGRETFEEGMLPHVGLDRQDTRQHLCRKQRWYWFNFNLT